VDVLAIVDTSVTTTKKTTVDELLLGMLASTTNARFKVGTFTRDMSVGTGNVPYIGVGFKPKAIFFFGTVTNGLVAASSKGFSDGTSNYQLLDYTTTGTNAGFTSTTNAIYLFDDAATIATNGATVASFDADGFTLAWTKANSPTSTANIYYLAFR
jgi:hypothetical protein